MKISYRTHPLLLNIKRDELNSPDLQRFIGPQYWRVGQTWKLFCPFFKKNIKCFSTPFLESYKTAKDKLMAELPELSIPECEGSGVIVCGKRITCYVIRQPNSGYNHLVVDAFLFDEDRIVGFMLGATPKRELYIDQYNPFLWFDESFASNSAVGDTIDLSIKMINEIISIINFLKYCPIEIKNVKGNSRLRDVTCKYINESDLDIQYIDSSWFTTRVRSEGFSVRSHLRLQPKKKNGEWTKEIIWINEYMKEGYTAPARKLSHT